MPLPLGHGLVGASIVAALCRQPPSRRYILSLFAGAFLANAADLDFLLVAATGSRDWHRGFSHSIVFSLFVFLLFVYLYRKRQVRKAVSYGLAYASHALLDFVTSKEGGGVELLWPFSTERLKLGWWGLSEVPSRMSRGEIAEALVLELALFTPLLFVAGILRRVMTQRTHSTADSNGSKH